MKKFFAKILSSIKQSCYHEGVLSSSRIASFVILVLISLCLLYFIGISCYIAIFNIDKTAQAIPSDMLIIFSSLLLHHLTLLGIYKKSETKIKEIEKN